MSATEPGMSGASEALQLPHHFAMAMADAFGRCRFTHKDSCMPALRNPEQNRKLSMCTINLIDEGLAGWPLWAHSQHCLQHVSHGPHACITVMHECMVSFVFVVFAHRKVASGSRLAHVHGLTSHMVR